MRPYFYKLKEKSTGKYYVGCQYGQNSTPDNLWNTYFTSNKYILSKDKNDFEIMEIVERIDAREYERKYLQRCYRLLGRDKFLEIMINRNIAPGILNTCESINKANEKRKISNSISAKQLMNEGRHNFQLFPAGKNESVRKNRSMRMIGNKLGAKRKITSEYRERQAEGARGNTNVRGTIWVINCEGTRKRVQPTNIPAGFKPCRS